MKENRHRPAKGLPCSDSRTVVPCWTRKRIDVFRSDKRDSLIWVPWRSRHLRLHRWYRMTSMSRKYLDLSPVTQHPWYANQWNQEWPGCSWSILSLGKEGHRWSLCLNDDLAIRVVHRPSSTTTLDWIRFQSICHLQFDQRIYSVSSCRAMKHDYPCWCSERSVERLSFGDDALLRHHIYVRVSFWIARMMIEGNLHRGGWCIHSWDWRGHVATYVQDQVREIPCSSFLQSTAMPRSGDYQRASLPSVIRNWAGSIGFSS